jgi:hypothetical protein
MPDEAVLHPAIQMVLSLGLVILLFGSFYAFVTWLFSIKD